MWFLSNTEGHTGLFSKNKNELFYELSVTLIQCEPSSKYYQMYVNESA